MALTFPPQGTPHWMRRVEQALLQNHVDIQRLWGIVPQIPDQVPGIPFTGPLEPSWFVVPSSTSSQRSRSSHNSSTSQASSSSSSGSSSSAAGSSSGSSGSSGSSSHDCSLDTCAWIWDDSPTFTGNYSWKQYAFLTTCASVNGCDCATPTGVGAYYGEIRYADCGGVAGSSSSGSSGSSSSNGECGGTCLITYIAAAWMVMSDNCTGVVGCECVIPEEASYEGDIRTVSCWPALDP